MNTLIVYASRYGNARRYAEKLSFMTGLPALSYQMVRDLSACDRVIYFGGVYAGKITGLSKIRKLIPKTARVTVCSVGLVSPDSEAGVTHIRKSVSRLLPRAEHFHLRGGIDYAQLSFVHRTMMKMLCAVLRRKEQKTPDDETLLQTYGGKADFVDLDALIPIAETLK